MAKYRIIPSSRTIVQSPISIGHKAEKGVEAIEFDLTAWVETYGSGTLTVIMRRWGDAIPYPIALEIDENNKATWVLSDTDTARAGMAYAQLSYIVGETVVKKSDIYTFRVMDSLVGEGEPPEAYESWLENLTHLAAEAMAEVLDIEGIVTDKTLTVDGGVADAKATGEALAEKVDAADYRELSDRVGRNTIALAEKADRSTTYTKTEVDALIDEVEVETDTTLEIAGAPADAKKVGDELSDIKADLGDKVEYTHSSSTSLKNCDLDDIITPGSYKVTSISNARTVTNIPVEQGGVLLVSIMQANANVWQRYIVLTANNGVRIYDRVQSNGTWKSWFVNTTSLDIAKKLSINNDDYISIQSGSDLNDITNVGAYKSTSSSVTTTLLNKPPINIGFLLLVSNVTSNSAFLQIVIGASDTSLVYLRYINPTDDVFGEWHKIQYDDIGIESTLAALGNSITSNTARILALETAEGIAGGYYTPYTEQEQAFYDKINNDIDKNTLVFLISADNHYRETKPEGEHQVEFAEVMAKMAKRLRCDAIINLGDIITQYIDSIDDETYANTDTTAEEVNTMRLAKMATAFQSTGVPFLYTIGHHEMGLHTNASVTVNSQTQTNTYPYPETRVLGICGKGAEWLEEHHYSQDPLSSGYYVDFPRHKVRLISIDSVSYTLTGFSPDSIAFITEAFANVPSGYKVIVFSHVASRYPGVYSANVDNGSQVETIMQNYVSGGGTILAYIHGHSHFDNVVTIEGVPYPYVCICCAENSWSTVGEKIEAGVLGNPVSYKAHSATRGAAIGTYNEYLFDVVCVHPDRDTINFFRFGIGEDRMVTLPTE